MAVTDAFKNILRRNRRNFGEEEGVRKALEEADDFGIEPFRERRKKMPRFKRQEMSE